MRRFFAFLSVIIVIVFFSGNSTNVYAAGSYKVTFNANGGSVTPGSTTFVATTSYKFNGWGTTSTATSGSAAGTTITPTTSALPIIKFLLFSVIPVFVQLSGNPFILSHSIGVNSLGFFVLKSSIVAVHRMLDALPR